ncbi:uncharacterized protein LOC119685523 isoform X3 [Teleopsis dalmanni]|uniref:uncharacterized protein LOC119685523 isoform X3 n=1 Tax=Teleopsis dalmanni TaxID=139649 RepID=UPI0018CE5928|nr:uncharacterized protein LOC119685523 isoform X3 [Teleopsis dalmanni]
MDTNEIINNLSNVTTSQNGISFDMDITSTDDSITNQGATGEEQPNTCTLLESNKTKHQQDIDYLTMSSATISTHREHSMEQNSDLPWKSSNVKTTKNGISFDIKYSSSLPLLTQSGSASKKEAKIVQTHLQCNKTDQKQNFDSIDYTKLSSAITEPHRAEGENQATDKLTTISKDIAFSTQKPAIFSRVSSTKAKHRTLEEIMQKLFDAAVRRHKYYQNYDVLRKVGKVIQNRHKMFTSYRQLIETRLSSRMKQYDDRRSKKILSIQRKAQSENSKLKSAAQKVEMAREKIIRNYSEKLEKMKNITKLKDNQYFVNIKSKRVLPRSFKLLDNRKCKQQKRNSVAKSNKEITVKVTNQNRDHHKDRFELFTNISHHSQGKKKIKPTLIQPHLKRNFKTKVLKQEEAAENVTKVVKKKSTLPRILEKTTRYPSTLQNEASKEKSELKKLKKAKTTLEARKPWRN